MISPTKSILLAALFFAQFGMSSRSPEFEDYRVPVLPNKGIAPKLATPGQRRFRTMIRETVKKGPNFAGHFTISEWGCGSGCLQFVITDNLSGEVFDGPFGRLPKGLICFGANTDEDQTGLFFHSDSSLLIARGCPNDEACYAAHYVWTGKRFKQLQRTPIKTPLGCDPPI